MAFKGDDSTLSLATTVTLALAVAAMVFVKTPLQSSRPLGSGTGLHQTTGELKVPARLWEDPFTAVERALEAQKPIAVQIVADGKNLGLITATVAQQSHSSDGLESLRSRISEADSKSILALVAMTQGGSSVEVREERIRDRYAVGAALEVGCFVPEQGESLSYFMWDFPVAGHANQKGRKSKSHKTDKVQYTPYEWYSRNEIGTCRKLDKKPEDLIRHVLVLWVKTVEDEETILSRIDALIGELHSPLPPKHPVQVKLIGPRNSSDFQSMLKEIAERPKSEPVTKYSWQQAKKDLQVYSPWATAMQGLLSYGLKGLKDMKGEPCRFYAECEEASTQLLKKAGLDIQYRVTSDEALFESLLKELDRRRVAIGEDRIVLIGEWDSFYARALPLTFTAAACQHVTMRKKDNRCNHIEDGIDQLLKGTLSPGAFNIRQYSYLRGLDGEASEDQARRTKSKKEDKDRDKDKTESKESLRDIDSYERPEGQAQLDYVRRLVARIKAECQDNRQAEVQQNAKVKAIGILGRDPYDALLILQAVREQFPNTLFFATDLDARYFHEDELKWTRNLIVASQFGLQLEPLLQQSIPPFRNSLQTSAFYAVLQAVDRVAPQPERMIPSRLFEIGRHGAVDLSVEDTTEVQKSVHPTRADVSDHKKTFKLPSRLGPLWITGAVLIFLVLWGWGNLWNWLMSRPVCNRHLGIPRKSHRLAWVLLFPMLVAFFITSAMLQTNYVEDEPFSWFDGVSLWPTEVLRVFTAGLCIIFMIKAHSDSVRNRDDINATFFQIGLSCNIEDRWRRKLVGFWSNLDWMFHGAKQDSPLDARVLWDRYCQAHTAPQRAARIVMGFAVYFSIIFPIFMFMNNGELRLFVPCRGNFSCKVDFVVTLISVISFIILNLAVLDAVILCTRWVQEMAGAKDFIAMKQIRLIVERTRIVNRRILYPFLALFLLIAARSHYFDNWDFPPPLIIVLTVQSLVALASATMLYLAAVQAKRRILVSLQHRLDRASPSSDQLAFINNNGSSNEGLRQIITDIEAVQQGAFAPFYQQPVIQATLVAALAFLQYWYLGQ